MKQSIALRKRAIVVVALVAALFAGAASFAQPAAALFEVHTIRSALPGNLCLDVQWNFQNNKTPVWMYSCNGTDAQNWTFRSLGIVNGRERFLIIDPYGYCLDAPAEYGGQPGHGVQIYWCNGGPTQVWQQTPGGMCWCSTQRFVLYNEYNHLYLDDANFGGEGTRVVTWPFNNGTNQFWHW